MKITVGSPNPPSAWSRPSTPVAHSDSATPNATTPIGNRSQTKTTTVAPRIRNVMVESLNAAHRRRARLRSVRQPVCTGEPGPSGIPRRYQATKNSVQTTVRTRTYGSIIATTVPMPASFLYRCVKMTMSGK